MTTYQIENGKQLKTKNSRRVWHCRTGIDPYLCEYLHMTRRGAYWVEHLYTTEGNWAEMVSQKRAAIWLTENGYVSEAKELEEK